MAKFGYRTPSFKKSFSSRTVGRVSRTVRRSIDPTYGKKGFGAIKNPSKSAYNYVYHKTSADSLAYLRKIRDTKIKDINKSSVINLNSHRITENDKQIDKESLYLPDDLKLKLHYNLVNVDKYTKNIKALHIETKSNINFEYSFNKDQIETLDLMYHDIYHYLKEYDKKEIQMDKNGELIQIKVCNEVIGEPPKQRGNKLYRLYTENKIDSMTLSIYGGEIKNLGYYGYSRSNKDHKKYKIELLVYPHESDRQKKNRIDKLIKQMEDDEKQTKETENINNSDEKEIIEKKKPRSRIIIVLIVVIILIIIFL